MIREERESARAREAMARACPEGSHASSVRLRETLPQRTARRRTATARCAVFPFARTAVLVYHASLFPLNLTRSVHAPIGICRHGRATGTDCDPSTDSTRRSSRSSSLTRGSGTVRPRACTRGGWDRIVIMTAIGVLLMWGGMTEATTVNLNSQGLTTANLTAYLPCGAGMPPRVACGTTTRM